MCICSQTQSKLRMEYFHGLLKKWWVGKDNQLAAIIIAFSGPASSGEIKVSQPNWAS